MTQEKSKANVKMTVVKENATSKETIEQTVENQIKYFQTMHQYIVKRRKFEETKKSLESLNIDENKEEFDRAEEIRLILKQPYSNGELFTISNPFIIKDLVESMIKKIEIKISELDAMILN